MKNYLPILVCILFINACSRNPSVPNNKIIAIEQQKPVSTLFYAGTIQPQKIIVVPSPADAAVVEMPVQYGEEVKPGQLLFVLSSSKFLSDYKTALTAYVKAKSQFSSSEVQLKESDFLHKNQLISDDDYKNKETAYYSAQLELVQAKDNLETLMQQMGVKDIDLQKLSIANIDKITQAMHLQVNSEDLKIVSPAHGIMLGVSKNEDESKKVAKGDTVKQGDVLAVIGDMNGLSVKIKVNELTINQLHTGQKVKITGIAFPEEELTGQIQRLDKQGEITSGGLPTFNVQVIVKGLSKKQQQEIHVGMSAKVEIDIEGERQIMVPITAVADNNGISSVKLYDEKSGNTHSVNVETGKTTADAVVILSGLKVGDKIVVG